MWHFRFAQGQSCPSSPANPSVHWAFASSCAGSKSGPSVPSLSGGSSERRKSHVVISCAWFLSWVKFSEPTPTYHPYHPCIWIFYVRALYSFWPGLATRFNPGIQWFHQPLLQRHWTIFPGFPNFPGFPKKICCHFVGRNISFSVVQPGFCRRIQRSNCSWPLLAGLPGPENRISPWCENGWESMGRWW